MRVVAALGGNALLPTASASPRALTPRSSVTDQRAAMRVACGQLADLVDAGHELVVTHGNGPQVGFLMIQQRAAEHEVPAMPLDVLGAQTQGALGYLLQQELGAVLRRRGQSRPIATVVTQVVVDPEDPAFASPDKPVGPRFTGTELEHRTGRMIGAETDLDIDGARWRKGDGGAWRRVVASPQPLDICEAAAVRALLAAGIIPVCAGGGGAPVARSHDGNGLAGVEAVIDKDRTAALLCRLVQADALLILTEVDRVAIDFGTAQVRFIDRMTPEEASALLAAGQFPAGSMGPKVAAAIDVANRGGLAVITSLDRAVEALAGRAGTTIAPA